MNEKLRIKSNQLLLVEGKDEVSFFEALLNEQTIENFQVISVGGKDQFKGKFPALVKSEGFSEVNTLGLIRDAEENKANSAFLSICSQLKGNNLPVPKTINEVIKEKGMRVGIFIMPNNSDEGMLEDLCLKSIKKNSIDHCIEEYIQCCLDNLPDEEKNIKISKAKVLAFLATKNPLVNSLGVAAKNGYWNLKDDCFDEIKEFINKLVAI